MVEMLVLLLVEKLDVMSVVLMVSKMVERLEVLKVGK